MTQLHQSKIFANGSTALPKPVRDALGVKTGDRLRYVISENGVQVLKRLSDDNSLKVHAHDPALREALDAAEEAMDENRKLLRELK
jgi:bifunctional DNA-binding transcriptional regulator/antitoxin component of YhaV-PrlF toxin-antitoxin module